MHLGFSLSQKFDLDQHFGASTVERFDAFAVPNSENLHQMMGLVLGEWDRPLGPGKFFDEYAFHEFTLKRKLSKTGGSA
jgi:hypothetical protein